MGTHQRPGPEPPRNDARPATPAPAGAGWLRPAVVLVGLAAVVSLSFVLGNKNPPRTTDEKPSPAQPGGEAPSGAAGVSEKEQAPPEPAAEEAANPHGKSADPSEEKPAATPAVGGSFLEGFGPGKPAGTDGEAGNPDLANEKLEKRFGELAAINERLDELRTLVRADPAIVRTKEFAGMQVEKERLVNQLNKGLAAFEKLVGQARKARPKDPVPQWLTGELLILVGGEPEEILPYLQGAVDAGLDRPRILASLSRAQGEANRFEAAYRSARKAVEQDGQDRFAWKAFGQAAFNLEKFGEVIQGLADAFPSDRPEWAKSLIKQATDFQLKWQDEQRLRQAEQKADDLPRVRLVIEHRRFARGKDRSKVESTGRGEVVIELFEDQAPATVANFLSLVGQGFYNGTHFHMAESASVVAGGDPKSKNADPADDGTGGPGYVIPDEFASPEARGHFRGAVSMVNTGPHTAGSQFFITLVPKPEMDGHFTVFGRVVSGMDVVDGMTMGRTTPLIGHYGKVVPGDLIVRAEVVRKRGHEYRVIKEKER